LATFASSPSESARPWFQTRGGHRVAEDHEPNQCNQGATVNQGLARKLLIG